MPITIQSAGILNHRDICRTLIWVLLMLAAVPAAASDVISLQFENDILGLDDSDRHYTNGVELSWQKLIVGKGEPKPTWWPGRVLFRPGDTMFRRLSVGQNLYTPEDIETPDLILDDRPYAGWLHLDIGLIVCGGESMTALDLSLGIIGPSAQGEPVQKWIHQVIGSPEPEGWANQLHDELAVVLGFERRWSSLYFLGNPPCLDKVGLQADFIPYVDLALGNVFTHAGGGVFFRLGQGLEGDFGPPRIRPGPRGSVFFRSGKKLTWYLFAGVEGRLVAQNIFLDGNTFGSSHSVDKEPLVGDVLGGVAVAWLGARLAFTYVHNTKDFKVQQGTDHYGALTLSVRF